ncbi:MAG: protein kinase [Acidobacteria bacterium]|nr:protein kinase [Acidobacteriota bacterium]
MTPERYKQIDELLDSLLELGPELRPAFLNQACPDQALRRDVEALLTAQERAATVFDKPAMDLVAKEFADYKAGSLVGTTIGSYKIISLLGVGGMGEVYLARDSKLGRKVALKILPAIFTLEEERLRRFEQEARAASALNHPNIITIHEISEANGVPFIVTEYVEGQTLRRLLEGGRLRPEEALDIATQVASALEAAHHAHIIHRDIKPENIMLRPDGYVKVLDFGLAKLIEGRPSSNDSEAPILPEVDTAPGLVFGSVPYLSPEQARAQELEACSDLFSLGVVLYEMLTGQVPFGGLTTIDVITAILRDEPDPLSGRGVEVSADLERVVMKALAKDKVRRHQSAKELLAELKELIGRSQTTLPLRQIAPASIDDRRRTVGRKKERTELRQGLEEAASGHGLILCTAGEPGIGKTSLVDDFLNEVSAGTLHCIIARGRCSERLAGTEAYLPILEALESLLQDSRDASILSLIKTHAPNWYIQLTSAGNDPGAELAVNLHASSQERLKRELNALLQALSQQCLLILFLDDVHWADISTVELLSYLAGKFDGMRMLVILSYRPAELMITKHPFAQIKLDLQARGLCREIMLDFLSLSDVTNYVAIKFAGHNFPADFPTLIHKKTEGNPLFMVNLLRYLCDRGVIAEADGRWALAQSAPNIERELPESVRAMIQRKIEQLSEDDRRLLQTASVQGVEFVSAVVAEVLGQDAVEVEERLDLLDTVYGFVQLEDEREFPDGMPTLRYRFVHVLYQNALYFSLTRGRKASLNLKTAERLLFHYGEQSGLVASELAFHFEEARDYSRAVEYYLVAAKNKARVFANWEASALARRGLDVLKLMPETEWRDRFELQLLFALSVPLMSVKGYGDVEVTQAFNRAHDLSIKHEQDASIFPVVWGLWVNGFAKGDMTSALHTAERLVNLAEKSQEQDQLLQSQLAYGKVLSRMGCLSRSLEALQKSLSFYDREKHQSHTLIYGHDPGVFCLSTSVWTLWFQGYPERSSKRSDEACRLAEEVSHPQSLAFALFFTGIMYQLRREAKLAQKWAEKTISLATEHYLTSWLIWSRILNGWAVSEQGMHEEGLAQMREGLSGLDTIGAKLARPHFLGLIAEGLRRSGKVNEALQVVDEAVKEVENTGDSYYESELHRLKGEMILQAAKDIPHPFAPGIYPAGEAESSFQRALNVAQQQGAKMFELRATASLSTLYLQLGKQNEAQQRLSDVYGWFTEGLDTPDLIEAKSLLDKMRSA